jgi:hypothetical protein
MDKLSNKLNKKKSTNPQQKPPKPPKQQTKLGANLSPPPSTSPAPLPVAAQAEDKSKLEAMVKNMQGKGVDMGALLQEALAKMKKIPLVTQQQPPPPKRQKPNVPPPQKVSAPFPTPVLKASVSTTESQPPIAVPMPLPYLVKTTPIAQRGASQIKSENGPDPSPATNPPISLGNPPSLAATVPPLSSSNTETLQSLTSSNNEVTKGHSIGAVNEGAVEIAVSAAVPRGTKRALEM